jgi:hypothetical protein
MAGLRELVVQFGTEEKFIEHLAGLRWPGGFARAGTNVPTRHRQESVTVGTVSPNANRSDQVVSRRLSDGPQQRRVSAKFLQRELGVAYQMAWTMAHKLRHGLSEDPSCRCKACWKRTRPSPVAKATRQVPVAAPQPRQEPGRRC